MYGGFLQEGKLLALAYDLEQEIHPRTQPQFLATVPPEPADAGICANLPGKQKPTGKPRVRRHIGTGKPFKTL